MSKHQLQFTLYLTALLLSASVFLPLATIPLYGDASYYRIAEYEAYLVIVFAMIAPGLILAGYGKLAIFSPLGIWGVLFYPTLKSYAESANNTVLDKLGNNVNSAMSDFAANLFFEISDYHWGGYVFLFSLLAFTLLSCLYRLRV